MAPEVCGSSGGMSTGVNMTELPTRFQVADEVLHWLCRKFICSEPSMVRPWSSVSPMLTNSGALSR